MYLRRLLNQVKFAMINLTHGSGMSLPLCPKVLPWSHTYKKWLKVEENLQKNFRQAERDEGNMSRKDLYL